MSWNHDWNAFNKGVVEQFRANGGQVPGRKYPLILLTTTGAKSGLPRTTPLNYSTDDDRIIVIASKAASPTHPDWYYLNLAPTNDYMRRGKERLERRAQPLRQWRQLVEHNSGEVPMP